MTDQPYRATGGRMAAGVVLALALGVATPVLTVAELLTLTPVMQLSGVFMVFLFAFAGRLPAWLYMTVQLAASARLMGSTYMWMTMAAGTFPAILCMRGLMLKKPFFEQVRTGILFYLLGLVGAIMIATGTFGGNLIGQLSNSMIAQFRAMPDAFFAPFVETVNQRLEESGLSGLAPLMAPMTVATYRSQFIAVAELLGQTYQQALPGALIAGAAVSGVVGALWSNWQMARRGFATDYSYIEPTRWFLPRWWSDTSSRRRITPPGRRCTWPPTCWRPPPSSSRACAPWTASSTAEARPTAGAGTYSTPRPYSGRCFDC